jgi:hypothetical protein
VSLTGRSISTIWRPPANAGVHPSSWQGAAHAGECRIRVVARRRGTNLHARKTGGRRVQRPVIQVLGPSVILGTETLVVAAERDAVILEFASSSHGFCSPFAGGRFGGNDLERLARSAALVATDIASRTTTVLARTTRPDATVTFRFARARGDANSLGAAPPDGTR